MSVEAKQVNATKDYLGDSVYAEMFGSSVILTTENGLPTDPSNTITLEPEVMDALSRYLERHGSRSLVRQIESPVVGVVPQPNEDFPVDGVVPAEDATPHPDRHLIDGMRRCCDWLETHPINTSTDVRLHVFVSDADELRRTIRGWGMMTKYADDHFFYAEKKFNKRVEVSVCSSRENVCERVQVGERVVPAEPEKIVPATVERVEPVYVWRCPELLGGPRDEPAQTVGD